jgi:hypothetical protein
MWSSRKTEAKTQYKMTLPASIGKGRDGKGLVADIHALPHLLIAGIVGSGKTVLVHNILTSLISGNDSEWLRLILIDPKQVELDAYNGLAHLLTPVISDQRKAVKVFNWLIREIERRYSVLKAEGLREIDAYHVRARCVPAFEDHDDACSFGLDPGLQADKLDLQLRKLLLEFLAAHFTGRSRRFGCLVLLLLVFFQLATLPDQHPTRQSGNSPMILQAESNCLTRRARPYCDNRQSASRQ